MDLTIIGAKSNKKLKTYQDLDPKLTISDLKKLYEKSFPDKYAARQSFRAEVKGKSLKDNDILKEACPNGELYFKDLGPQIGWSTVFYTEYAGPLIVYLIFYARLPLIYGKKYAYSSSPHDVVHIAAACHTFHYVKRLIETKFIHRFSHGTMPIANLFKNSTYYWCFAAWQSYLINHPLYTPPSFGTTQINVALALFLFCEFGNFSIHIALKNLRPAGSKERKIPYPTSNPMTVLFNYVSCPNYTYEAGSWICFAVLGQCFASLVFATLGFAQMAVWALGKHRNYRREFRDYPRQRKAIVPFLL